MWLKNGSIQNNFWATLDRDLIGIGSSLDAELLVSILSLHVYVVVQFGFWFNLDFPLFDIHYHILA